jgi:two-component system, NarL family, sensor histidine kinase DevS
MDSVTHSLLGVARGVIEELDLDTVLDRVVEAAQELTGARYAALGVIDESRTGLASFITRGIDEATHQAIGALPRGRGVLGTLIEDPSPLRLTDVGAHPRSFGFPPGHPRMRSFLGAPIFVAGHPFGNLYLTEKADSTDFTAEDEEAVVLLAEFAGVAIDHARRFGGASERRDELEQTVASLEATTEIAGAVAGETDPAIVLDLIAKRGRALVSARSLVIELLQAGGLVVAAAAGEQVGELVGQRIELDGSLAQQAMRTRRPQYLEEDMNRVRFQEHGLGSLGALAHAGLVVPLIFRGHVYGVLVALDRLTGGPAFSAEDERLLTAFATSAAAAVATAQSVAAEHQRQRIAAMEAERQRWARELHDETLQGLALIRLELSAIARSAGQNGGQTVTAAIDQLGETIDNLRGLIADLRPAALDQLGLQPALETLAARVEGSGVTVDLALDLAYEEKLAESRLSDELETALYRIAQEALTNAIKHANAKRVAIELSDRDPMIVLSISDDGDGFDAEASTDGFGLIGMRERVTLLDGQLSVESSPQSGTSVTVRVPVRRRSGPGDAPASGDGAPPTALQA